MVWVLEITTIHMIGGMTGIEIIGEEEHITELQAAFLEVREEAQILTQK